MPPDGRKVKSTIHWVSAEHAIDAEVRLYETLFTQVRIRTMLDEGQDFTVNLNPEFTFRCLTDCKLEPSLRDANSGQPVSIRAAGLLLRGQGFTPRPSRLQSYRWPSRHVGQDRTARKMIDDHSWDLAEFSVTRHARCLTR